MSIPLNLDDGGLPPRVASIPGAAGLEHHIQNARKEYALGTTLAERYEAAKMHECLWKAQGQVLQDHLPHLVADPVTAPWLDAWMDSMRAALDEYGPLMNMFVASAPASEQEKTLRCVSRRLAKVGTDVGIGITAVINDTTDSVLPATPPPPPPPPAAAASSHAGEAASNADFGRRGVAVILDAVVWFAGLIPLVMLCQAVFGVESVDRGSGATAVGVGAVLWALACLVMPARTGAHNGQTFGKQLTRLRTVRLDGLQLTIKDVLVREAGLKWGAGLLSMGVWVLVDGVVGLTRGTMIHDMVAGTAVYELGDEPSFWRAPPIANAPSGPVYDLAPPPPLD